MPLSAPMNDPVVSRESLLPLLFFIISERIDVAVVRPFAAPPPAGGRPVCLPAPHELCKLGAGGGGGRKDGLSEGRARFVGLRLDGGDELRRRFILR